MLPQEEYPRVEAYLADHYALTPTDRDYLNTVDDYILSCSLTTIGSLDPAELLDRAQEVHRKLSAVFLLDGGCSPRLLEYQERYYQLMVLHAKATGQNEIAPLAMLCFTSSFDLFWLQAQQG